MTKINRERLLLLADRIERTPHAKRLDESDLTSRPRRFSMKWWNCGTAACIGGWAEAMFLGKGYHPVSDVSEALGLNRKQSDTLFFHETSADITPEQAASCLRFLAETGKVDWGRALRKASEG